MAIPIEQLPKVLNKKLKSVEFAGLVALTWTGKDAVVEVKKEIAEKFTLRNKWAQMGVRTIGANKQKPYAEVYHKDKFMAQHETGKDRQASEVGGEFWIPTPSALGGQGKYQDAGLKISKTKRIPKRYRPKNILNTKIRKKRPFIATMKSGYKAVWINAAKTDKTMESSGKTRPGGKRRIIPIYHIKRGNIDLKKREWFYKAVLVAYNKNIEKNYEKAFNKYVLKHE